MFTDPLTNIAVIGEMIFHINKDCPSVHWSFGVYLLSTGDISLCSANEYMSHIVLQRSIRQMKCPIFRNFQLFLKKLQLFAFSQHHLVFNLPLSSCQKTTRNIFKIIVIILKKISCLVILGKDHCFCKVISDCIKVDR